MSEDKFSATTSKSETGAAATNKTATRTVGVYERPAQGVKMSLPLVIILILAALVSVVATARFLF
jgi:hypothetical protein